MTQITQTTERSRQPLPKKKGLDILKGIAILGVFFYHLLPSIFPGGFLGVPLFFVLSGYLMYLTAVPYLEEGSFPVFSYYKKRIHRLVPPLFYMVMIICCVMTLTRSRQMIGIREQILSIFLGYNNWWQIKQDASYFTRLTGASPFTHLWFLGVEMQFYLIWPFLFFLYKKLRQRLGGARACYFFLALALLSLTVMIVLYHPGGNPTRVYYGTDTIGFTLCLGMFLGALRHDHPSLHLSISGHLQTPVYVCMIGIIILLYIWINGNCRFLYLGGMFLISLFFALIILYIEDHRSVPLKLPLAGPTALLGKYSYYIYLWHYPVIVLLLAAFH